MPIEAGRRKRTRQGQNRDKLSVIQICEGVSDRIGYPFLSLNDARIRSEVHVVAASYPPFRFRSILIRVLRFPFHSSNKSYVCKLLALVVTSVSNTSGFPASGRIASASSSDAFRCCGSERRGARRNETLRPSRRASVKLHGHDGVYANQERDKRRN